MNKKTILSLILCGLVLCPIVLLLECVTECVTEYIEEKNEGSVTGKILKVLLEYHFSGFKPVVVAMDNGKYYNFMMEDFAVLCLYEGKTVQISYKEYKVISIKEI